jgi:hypothetical protein
VKHEEKMTIKQATLLAAAVFGLVLLFRAYGPETPKINAGEAPDRSLQTFATDTGPDNAAARQNQEASDYNSTDNWPPRSYCTGPHGHFLDAVCRERMKKLW